MAGKLIEALYITGTTTAGVYYSSAISIGTDNGAMVELWVTTLGGGTIDTTNGIRAVIEGSNDGSNFDSTALATATNTSLPTPPGPTAAPMWLKGTSASVIPYTWLRLRIEIKAASGTATGQVSASIRTFKMA